MFTTSGIYQMNVVQLLDMRSQHGFGIFFGKFLNLLKFIEDQHGWFCRLTDHRKNLLNGCFCLLGIFNFKVNIRLQRNRIDGN